MHRVVAPIPPTYSRRPGGELRSIVRADGFERSPDRHQPSEGFAHNHGPYAAFGSSRQALPGVLVGFGQWAHHAPAMSVDPPERARSGIRRCRSDQRGHRRRKWRPPRRAMCRSLANRRPDEPNRWNGSWRIHRWKFPSLVASMPVTICRPPAVTVQGCGGGVIASAARQSRWGNRFLRDRRGCYGVEIATAQAPRNDDLLNSGQLPPAFSLNRAGVLG